jgi:hypothetical protein
MLYRDLGGTAQREYYLSCGDGFIKVAQGTYIGRKNEE